MLAVAQVQPETRKENIKMASNLPPGVTDSMIPGNRPEDREVEVTLVLSVGDIDDLRNADIKNDENLRITLAIILEQIDEQI